MWFAFYGEGCFNVLTDSILILCIQNLCPTILSNSSHVTGLFLVVLTNSSHVGGVCHSVLSNYM